MKTRAEIVARARLHVGHRETANNDSPLIRPWLRRCGVNAPSAWCAAFASWCVEERDEALAFAQGRSVVVACAGALRLGRMFLATRAPQPGDLMFFATDDEGHGHVGIVVAGDADTVLCIEGNSANMVRFVRRLRSEVLFASTRDEVLALPPLEAYTAAPLVRVSKAGTR